jgi:hypothetical protein
MPVSTNKQTEQNRVYFETALKSMAAAGICLAGKPVAPNGRRSGRQGK